MGTERSGLAYLVFAAALLACGSSVDVDPSDAGAGAGNSTSNGSGAGNTGTSSGSGAGDTGSSSGSGAGNTGTSSGSGGGNTGTSSSGGPPGEWCSECAEGAIDGPCASAWAACNNDFACDQLLKCHKDCEWTEQCNLSCDAIIPSAVPLLKQVMSCVACVSCPGPCANSSLMMYCN